MNDLDTIDLSPVAEKVELLAAKERELKARLDARADDRAAIVGRQATELTTFDAETPALEAERAEAKRQHGLYYEALGLAQARLWAMRAQAAELAAKAAELAAREAVIAVREQALDEQSPPTAPPQT
jgi:hypothetical protein